MSDFICVWEEPPGGARRPRNPRGYHAQVAERLRERPGQWGRVGAFRNNKSSATIASSIRRADLDAYAPRGTYEATARKVDGEYRVYARYVGQPDG